MIPVHRFTYRAENDDDVEDKEVVEIIKADIYLTLNGVSFNFM